MTSTEFSSTEDILGRADANDLDAILAVPNPYVDGVVHQVKDNADAIFTWDYEKGARPALSKLYEKAKKSQWNGETDLDWSLDVDQEALARMAVTAVPGGPELDLTGTCFEKFNDDDWTKVNIEMQNWTLSQFMHGEQGALICTAKIVETVPWIDAKYYAELSDVEMRERQEFAFEAAVRMRDRLLQQEVWERIGVPVKEAIELAKLTPDAAMFNQFLFSKIVPNCKKLGLLDASGGWLRDRFTEIGVIQFEDWIDTGDEYEQFSLENTAPDGEAASA